MAYSLLCTDLDGTLLRSDKTVSERTIKTIRAAFDRGFTVTFATGRLPAALRRYTSILPAGVPLLCGNGSLIAESGSGRVLDETLLQPDAVMELTERGFAFGATVVIWRSDTLWIEGDSDRKAEYEDHTGQRSLPLSDFLNSDDRRAHKVLFYADPPIIAPLYRSLREAPVPGCNFFTSSADTLECVETRVDKGHGLRRCAALLGVTPEETIAVGDGENDIAMLRAAGLGAAMANAESGVLASASLICPSNDEEGVAWLIENYLGQ